MAILVTMEMLVPRKIVVSMDVVLVKKLNVLKNNATTDPDARMAAVQPQHPSPMELRVTTNINAPTKTNVSLENVLVNQTSASVFTPALKMDNVTQQLADAPLKGSGSEMVPFVRMEGNV